MFTLEEGSLDDETSNATGRLRVHFALKSTQGCLLLIMKANFYGFCLNIVYIFPFSFLGAPGLPQNPHRIWLAMLIWIPSSSANVHTIAGFF